MAKPQDFSFSIEQDDEIGTYFQFYYNDGDEYAGVWEDLEEIIDNNMPNLLDRIEENSYEPSYNINTPIVMLKRLGFTKKV